MKLIYTLLIHVMNLAHCKVKYKLGEVDGFYFIYVDDNYKNIASISMKPILFLYVPILRLGDAYYTYEDDEKLFVLYHELGHYKLKHHLKYISLFDKKALKELEFEADEYAMNLIGKNITLKAMNRTRNILIELGCKLDDINERIELIELKEEYMCG